MPVGHRGAPQERGADAIWLTILGYLNAAIYGLLVIGLGSALLLAVLSLAQLLSGGIMWVELLLSIAGVFAFSRAMTVEGSKIGGGQ